MHAITELATHILKENLAVNGVCWHSLKLSVWSAKVTVMSFWFWFRA